MDLLRGKILTLPHLKPTQYGLAIGLSFSSVPKRVPPSGTLDVWTITRLTNHQKPILSTNTGKILHDYMHFGEASAYWAGQVL